jgi:hypothetical protein
VIALFAGAAALAQPSAGGDAAALKSSKDDPNRMICRSMNEGGTRLDRRRACHTAAEWAELRRQARQAIEHIQNSTAASY